MLIRNVEKFKDLSNIIIAVDSSSFNINDFVNTLVQLLELNSIDKENVKKGLLKALEGNYTLAEQFRDVLYAIQQKLLDQKIPDHLKIDIGVQLTDGAKHCTQGLHVRAEYGLLALSSPKNLSELIAKFHFDTVNEIARKMIHKYPIDGRLGLEVHQYRLIFNIVKECNFFVSCGPFDPFMMNAVNALQFRYGMMLTEIGKTIDQLNKKI